MKSNMHSNQAWLLVCWASRFFCGKEGTPSSSGFPPPLFPQEQEKGETQTHCALTIKRPFVNALRHFPCTSHALCGRLRFIAGVGCRQSLKQSPTVPEYLLIPGSWLLWGKLRLVLHFFPLPGNDLLQTGLYLSMKRFSCDKGTVFLNGFARKVLVRLTSSH